MSPHPEPPQPAPAPVAANPRPTAPSRLRRTLFAPLKGVIGMVFCQSPLGGLGALGWTCRLMQRVALAHWWKASAARQPGEIFADFAAADPRTRDHTHWPNWFLAQNFRQTRRAGSPATLLQQVTRFAHALFASLWQNVATGVRAAFNVWVFTLPGCILMLFGWYDGWHNSFNKGYEQFWVGPLSAWLGILLLIAALFYVPLAQARQAVTGDWRAFYQFGLVRRLARRRCLGTTALAGLYALASLPVAILASIPMFLPQMNPRLAEATPAEAAAFLNSYYFWAAAFILPAFVLLRLLTVRLYASALLDAVQSGAVAEDELAENEWHALHRLDLLHVRPVPPRNTWVRIVTWAGSRAGRITLGLTAFLLWFLVVGQTVIQQFFHYTGSLGWLNHPLIQLPWFHRLPASVQHPWAPVGAAAAIVFAAWQIQRLVRWVRSLRRP